MTGRQKRKGDAAEREVVALLHDLLGVPARRELGAGRADDVGDIDGVPQTAIQVTSTVDLARALRVKPVALETQRRNRAAAFGATFVRLHGGEYRVVLTPEQWAAYWREATA